MGAAKPRFKADGEVYEVAISPDGKMLAISEIITPMPSEESQHIVRLLDAETGKENAYLSNQMRRINNLAFSPGGKYLVKGSDLWDLEKRTDARLVGENICGMVFHPDGELVATTWEGGAALHKMDWKRRN